MKAPASGYSARFVLMATVFLLPAWSARASEPAEVEALIEQANDLRRQGKDGKALPLMRKAYDLAGTARTAAQLGLVEVALGYWLPAEQHLLEALSSPRDPWIYRNRAELERVLAGVRLSIGELRIEGEPPGAEVLVNGQLAGTLPLPKPVRVGDGPVRLEVRAAGYLSSSQTLTMRKGAAQRVDVRLARAPAAPPAPPPAPQAQTPPRDSILERRGADTAASTHRHRAAAWITAGAATAALGLGIAQSLAWIKKRDEFDNHAVPVLDNSGMATTRTRKDCGRQNENRGGEDCRRIYDEMSRAQTFAVVGYVSAGLLAAGATTLFVLAPGGEDRRTAHTSIACAPTLEAVGGACRFVF